MQPYRSWLGLGLVLALAACNPLSSFGNKPVSDYKINSSPEQRYDITMTIANAPGPFASMEGLVQYDVSNSLCLPPPDSNPGGYSAHMTRHIPFVLTRVSETHYTGTVFADLMLDEDYHGRGVCHWKLIQARVHMKATGADGETLFIPSLSVENLFDGKAVTTYFLKKSYPRHPESTLENPVAFGQSDRSKMMSTIKDDELFTITLTPKEVQP